MNGLSCLCIAALTTFSLTFSLRAQGIEPLSYFSTIEIEAKDGSGVVARFGLTEVRPTNVLALLAANPESAGVYRENRIETAMLISLAKGAYKNALARQRKRSLTLEEEEFIDRRLASLDTGKYPIYLITDYHDPYIVYLTIAVGWDYGAGMPSEIFCKENHICDLGLAPVQPAREEGVPLKFVPRSGLVQVNDDVSKVLSSLPRITQARTEILAFGTPSISEQYDLVEFIHKRIIANQDTLHSRIANHAPVTYTPEQQDRLGRLPVRFKSDIEKATAQEWVSVSDIFIWMLGDALQKYYQVKLGFGEALLSFKSAGPKTGFVSKISRVAWETMTMELLEKRSKSRLISQASIEPRSRQSRSSLFDTGLVLGVSRLGMNNMRVFPSQVGDLDNSLFFQPHQPKGSCPDTLED